MHETLLNRLRNYYHAHPWFKQLIDQTGHLLGAALILAPSVWGHFWASALLIGALREVEQIRRKQGIGFLFLARAWIRRESWSWHWRRTLDVAFWGVGGLVVSVVAWLA